MCCCLMSVGAVLAVLCMQMSPLFGSCHVDAHVNAQSLPPPCLLTLLHLLKISHVQVLQNDRFGRKGTNGRPCSWRLAEELVAEVDLDRDGTVSYEEYTNMWSNPQEAVAA